MRARRDQQRAKQLEALAREAARRREAEERSSSSSRPRRPSAQGASASEAPDVRLESGAQFPD